MVLTPGFVVEANVDEQWVRKFIADSSPTTMLFINRPDLASLAADLGVPNSILRIKTNSINDDQLHVIFRDAQEWWDAVKHHYADKRLIVYVGNELNGDWNKINRFLSDAVDIIETSGRRGVYGNFGVGNPEPVHWSTFLSGLVAKLNQKPNQYMGIHEYYIKHPFLGVDGYTWNGSTAIDITPNVPMKDRTKWILGRYEFLLRVAPNVQIMITEFGADHVVAIAQQFSFPTSLRGWASQYNGDQNAALEHFRLALNTFFTNRNICGILFFIVGGFGWEDFDFKNANTILNRWKELRINIPMAGTVTIKDIDVEIAATDLNYNIRASAPNGTVLGGTKTIIPTFTKVRWLESVTGLDNSGHAWSKYSGLPGIATGIGWIRDDGVQRRDIVEPEPQPSPENQFITLPIPEIYLGAMSEAEIEFTASILDWISLSAKSLSNYVREKIN
jgi:hypothetical protein